jgi:hypothetical protein
LHDIADNKADNQSKRREEKEIGNLAGVSALMDVGVVARIFAAFPRQLNFQTAK